MSEEAEARLLKVEAEAKRLEEEARRTEARWLKEEPARRAPEDLEEDMAHLLGRPSKREAEAKRIRKRLRPAGAKPRCGLAWFVLDSQR
jgi:hypothetical protein